MKIIHEIMETGALQVNCQILANQESKEALLIDPGGHAEQIQHHLESQGLRLTHIVNTHGHFDHIGAVAALQQETGCQFWMHQADQNLLDTAAAQASAWGMPFGDTPKIDRTLNDNEILSIIGLDIQVIHTPGHTQGGVCLRWESGLAVGDTLFQGSIGRTDLPGGNTDQLISSIKKRLMSLDDDLVCFPGHGPVTTIGQERRNNPFI